MTYLYTKFLLRTSRGPLVIAVNLKVKDNFRSAAVLDYILQRIASTEVANY
jgi:hypothetical protein